MYPNHGLSNDRCQLKPSSCGDQLVKFFGIFTNDLIILLELNTRTCTKYLSTLNIHSAHMDVYIIDSVKRLTELLFPFVMFGFLLLDKWTFNPEWLF